MKTSPVTFTVEFHTDPDRLGRRQYTMTWICPSTGRKRGQVFFANPEQNFADLRSRGHAVQVQR